MTTYKYIDKTLASNEIERCIGSVTSCYYEHTIGPFNETTRISYTCPADRRAAVKLVHLFYEYFSAPASGIRPFIRVKINDNTILFLPIPLRSTDRQMLDVTPNIILGPGDSITVSNYDNNSGSSIFWVLTLVLNEYYL